MEENSFDIIIGEFTHTIYRNDNYMVCKFDSEDGLITVTGPSFDIEKHQMYELTGSYVDHPKYGFQFNFIKINKYLSTNKEQIISFLKSESFKGVGKVAAEKIYNHFKDNTLKILKDDPNLIYEVKLTDKQYLGVIAGFESLNDPQNEIMFYLISNGFNSNEANKIFTRFKLSTIEIASINPFKYYNDVDGIRFNSVKSFAYNVEFEDKETKYKESYLIYALKEITFNRGDIYVEYNDLKSIVKIDDFDDILSLAINDNYLLQEDNRIYLFSDYNDELFISDYLKNFNTNQLILENELIEEGIKKQESQFGITYDKKQIDAIKAFFSNNVSLIVGGPGTGKTTIVKGMVDIFEEYFPFSNLIAVAPTGRAAKRIAEVCECEAKTIHSLLRWNLESNTFVYDIDNPIMYDALIIDEFSMVDNNLFACLLKACRNVKKICIIGDDNQLPSIRSGYVLNDLINCNMFACVHLTTNFRQTNGNEIIDLSNDIINNDVKLVNYTNDISFYDLKRQNVDIVSMIKKDLDNGYSLDEIQVLAPMYRGEYGIDNLNVLLQQAFNNNQQKPCKQVGKYLFRVDDKIIQLKNRPSDDVYNGDIGKLIEIDEKEKCFVVDYNNTIVFYQFDDLNDISLAYALSVHKSQGSEYQIVYFVLTRNNIHMLNKKLIYTAISRAKSKLIILGDEDAFMRGLLQNMKPRKTTLLNKLINSAI